MKKERGIKITNVDKTTKNGVLHTVIDSGFRCEDCGSRNIKERSGYKVCFDCGKSH